jgi:hypothetical protein
MREAGFKEAVPRGSATFHVIPRVTVSPNVTDLARGETHSPLYRFRRYHAGRAETK